MPTLYLNEDDATLRRAGNHLLVTGPGNRSDGAVRDRTLLDLKPHHIEGIALVGRAHITSSATRFCLDRGIPVAWLSGTGDFLGRMAPEINRNADLRLAQCAAALDKDVRLAHAATFVTAKCRNAVAALGAIRSNHTGNPVIPAAIKALKRAENNIRDCKTVERLRGIEGDCARRYFAALAQVFIGGIPFASRKKYPAPDPANAMLSLGYTLFANLIAGAVEARGLDPAVGFYHDPRSGRSSLALDLLEEFRHPLVDRFVVGVANRRILTPDHFEEKNDRPGAVILNSTGRRKFFTEWEKRMRAPLRQFDGNNDRTPPEIMRRQVDRIAAAVRGQTPYEPFFAG